MTGPQLMKSSDRFTPVAFVEKYLRQYVDSGSIILDVGCGPALYRNSTPARYIGVDSSIDSYREVSGDGIMDIVASASELPFSGDRFDVVFVKSALYQFRDTVSALNEFYRVLRTGGRVLIFDYNKRTQKRVQVKEGHNRPCWTQWELMGLVRNSGFRKCELLVPAIKEINIYEKYLRLVKEELFGTWAIVTGLK